ESYRYGPPNLNSLACRRAGTCIVDGGVYHSSGSAHETVKDLVSIDVKSHDATRAVDSDRDGSLNRARACARNIEGREGASGSTQKAVTYSIAVHIESRDFQCRVDAERDGSPMCDVCRRPGNVEFGYRAVGSAQEAVIGISRVSIHSRDIPSVLYFYGEGSLIQTGAGVRSIERSYRACRGRTHKPVGHIGRG